MIPGSQNVVLFTKKNNENTIAEFLNQTMLFATNFLTLWNNLHSKSINMAKLSTTSITKPILHRNACFSDQIPKENNSLDKKDAITESFKPNSPR